MEIDDEHRPAARGHDRHDPGDVAVGHRQPLRGARPGPERRGRDRRRRAHRRRRDHRRRWTSTSSSTRSTRRPARGSSSSCRARPTYYGGRSEEASQSLEYLSPALSATSRLTREIVIDEGVFERFLTDTSRLVGAVAERRERPGGAGGQRQRHRPRDRRRERGARPHARPAADHAAQGQHDVREPARRARRPGRAGGRVEAGHRRTWRPSCAPCARSWPTPGPTIADLRELIRKRGAEQRPDRADGEDAAARGPDLARSSRARSGRSTARSR